MNIVQIACGSSHCLALDHEGTVYSWGNLGGATNGHGAPNPNTLL